VTFMVDTPYTPAYIRNEFLYDHQTGSGEFTPCTIFGFRAEPARVPMFSVMAACGAQWARVPIHALVSKPCPPMALELACWWDSFSRHAEVREMEFLRGHRVRARGRDGVWRPGVYLFSIFWHNGGWSEVSDQSKDHHIVRLEAGPLIAYPNNKLHWVDPSHLSGDPPRDWKSPSQSYSAEALWSDGSSTGSAT
jgi:hypothetical protein